MGISLDVHGRVRAKTAVLAMLAILFVIAGVGCEARRSERETEGKQSSGEPKATTSASAKQSAKRGESGSESADLKPSGRTRVRLTQRDCIQFEPHWTTIQVGQSLTWVSEVKAPVTVHVSPGVFDRNDFQVRAGESTNSGPARHPGSFTIWTQPTACQGVASGIRGTGPGVTVEGAPLP